MNELQQLLHAFEQLHPTQNQAALVTVVRTRGSVYRRPGARMLITQDGRMISAVSGGCLEADIGERSRLLLAGDQAPQVVRYDTTASDDLVVGFGLGCNGVVDVLIESFSDVVIHQLHFIQSCFTSQRGGAIATVFAVTDVPGVQVGDRLMLSGNTPLITRMDNDEVAHVLAIALQATLIERQTRVQSYAVARGYIDVLLEFIPPPVPLLIFGAGYDAIPVVRFAKQLGWQVTVLDHRSEHLTRDRFPLADRLVECVPERPETYQSLLNPHTVAIVMTHRYVSDLAFLKTLIPARLSYLGVLGPKQRMQTLWHDLATHHILPIPELTSRLYNPMGLDIGAETPDEIALAIVAEIQAVLSGRSGTYLRDRPGSIHASPQLPCLELAS